MTALAPAEADDGSGSWPGRGRAGQHDGRELTAAERDGLRELGAGPAAAYGVDPATPSWQPVRRLLRPLDAARESLALASRLRHHERGSPRRGRAGPERCGQLGTAWGLDRQRLDQPDRVGNQELRRASLAG